MFSEPYLIQFSAVFVTFLLWFLNSLVLLSIHLKNGDNSLQYSHGPTVAHTEETGIATTHKDHIVNIEKNDHRLLKAFLFLSVGVILNVIVGGSKTSGDVFSLIVLFSLAISCMLHFLNYRAIGNGFWVLLLLALFGLYITPWVYTRSGQA
ncbi:hypothetical protein K502DRAFT_318308 [Neoconidiobolus thromboides FSU 785]|nr:hypothetical protein K502DRAFT_318308 [Neoconidiobolus thromboides FSU 785]